MKRCVKYIAQQGSLAQHDLILLAIPDWFAASSDNRKEINYNLRIKNILALPKTLTTSFGINSISSRGSILRNGTPDVIKSSNTVLAFMKNIKNGSGEVNNCSICI